MSSPARSWSSRTQQTASVNCSRNARSVIASENGRPSRLVVYQVGRGQDPVTVVGRMRSLVAVSTESSSLFDLPRQCDGSQWWCAEPKSRRRLRGSAAPEELLDRGRRTQQATRKSIERDRDQQETAERDLLVQRVELEQEV